MAHYQEHVKDCEDQLGDGYEVVHRWLDEFAQYYHDTNGFILSCHRVERHHREGVEEVREKWGDIAAMAAEIHILKDEKEILTRKQMREKYQCVDS